MWILRILGPIKFYKGPIKISNGPLNFGNLHVFEWDMGHWPIIRAHHYFGLGLTLNVFLCLKKDLFSILQKLVFLLHSAFLAFPEPFLHLTHLFVSEEAGKHKMLL